MKKSNKTNLRKLNRFNWGVLIMVGPVNLILACLVLILDINTNPINPTAITLDTVLIVIGILVSIQLIKEVDTKKGFYDNA